MWPGLPNGVALRVDRFQGSVEVMLLARGSVTDRPWGLTLGALGMKHFSGQLTVVSEGKEYAIVFNDGAIIGASSPAVADAAVRIALTNHLISKTQVNDLTR